MDARLQKRNFGIDLARALAILGVLLVHTSTDGYQNAVGSFDWWGAILWGALCRRNVPLFLMCSGAILLSPNRELSLKKLWLHNLLRVLVALLAWAMIFKVYHLIKLGEFSGAALWQGFKETLLFKQEWHLYYLQIILLVYAWLPVTRLVAAHATRRQLEYTLAVWFACGILYPTLKPFWPFNLLYGIPSQWLLNMTYAAIGYGLLGHYLRTYPLSWRLSACLTGAASLFLLLGTWLMSLRQGSTYTGFFEGMSVGPALLGAGVFGLCLSVKRTPLRALGWITTQLSRGSLCIYVCHAFFLETFAIGRLPGLPTLLSIPLLALGNLALCYVIYFLLSKIPVVKKWLV